MRPTAATRETALDDTHIERAVVALGNGIDGAKGLRLASGRGGAAANLVRRAVIDIEMHGADEIGARHIGTEPKAVGR